MILESDGAWKTAIEQKIFNIEHAVSRVSRELNLPELMNTSDETDDPEMQDHAATAGHGPGSSAANTPQNFEVIMDRNSGPAAIPGSIISPVSDIQPTTRNHQDVIHREIVSVGEAQQYLDVYQNRLDHFLYSILGDRRDLSQIRTSSPTLLAAISAVGALHLRSDKFDELFKAFVSHAASTSFSRHCSLDDIRALCIGAFWLSSISWTCIGTAVRLCSELQLHRSIFRALAGDRQHYLRTRLYYLVYVCDHHFSIAYGRPPMTREDDAISACPQFLELEMCTQDDTRLISQVQFWMVGSEIYQVFGVDVDRPLNSTMIGSLRRLSIKLDKVRTDWTEAFSVNKYVGNYPKKGVGLHYQFARLYLSSMAFRGIGQSDFKEPDIAMDIEEIANTAILSATTILRTVVSDTEIQSYLNGLPTYFDVMIAFAVVFLVKVSTAHTSTVAVNTREVLSLVGQLSDVLQAVTTPMHPRHMLVGVAKGTADLLRQCSQIESQASVAAPQGAPQQTTLGGSDNQFDFPTGWPEVSFDDFMGEFDFLADQGAWDFPQMDGTF